MQISETILANESGKYGFNIVVALQRSSSKGTVRLQSGNPFHHPLIDPKYLQDDEDLENLLYGKNET